MLEIMYLTTFIFTQWLPCLQTSLRTRVFQKGLGMRPVAQTVHAGSLVSMQAPLECECSLHNFTECPCSKAWESGNEVTCMVLCSKKLRRSPYNRNHDLNHFPISVERFLHLQPSKEA